MANLAVDNESFMHDLIRVIADTIGIADVATVPSGGDALLAQAEADRPFKGLLAVIAIAGKDVVDLFARVRSIPACGNVPIIMMTALDDKAPSHAIATASAIDGIAPESTGGVQLDLRPDQSGSGLTRTSPPPASLRAATAGAARSTVNPPEPTGRPNNLRTTPRQREIIELIVAGKSNKEMARSLNLSEGTVKFHMSSAFRLLGAKNRVEAATAGARLLRDTAAPSLRS